MSKQRNSVGIAAKSLYIIPDPNQSSYLVDQSEVSRSEFVSARFQEACKKKTQQQTNDLSEFPVKNGIVRTSVLWPTNEWARRPAGSNNTDRVRTPLWEYSAKNLSFLWAQYIRSEISSFYSRRNFLCCCKCVLPVSVLISAEGNLYFKAFMSKYAVLGLHLRLPPHWQI